MYDLQEIKDRIVTYAIPGSKDMKWSVLFTKLELNSTDLGIEDYTVSNASLAQVSIEFYLHSLKIINNTYSAVKYINGCMNWPSNRIEKFHIGIYGIKKF